MELDSKAIAKFCQKHHITRMLNYAHPHRPVAERNQVMDFLVEFEPGHAPGYFDMFGGPGLIGMEEELAEMLGKECVYLMSISGIGPHFRTKALDDARAAAKPLYPVQPST